MNIPTKTMSDDDIISSFYNAPVSPGKQKPVEENKSSVAPKKEVKKKEIISDKSAQSAKIYKERPSAEAPIKGDEIKSFEKYFEKVAIYHDEIQNSLEKIYAALGQTRESIQNYLDNPNNFSEQEYKKIQERRENLKKDLLNKLSKETRDSIQLRSQREKSKKQKGKMIGARKRWLTMD